MRFVVDGKGSESFRINVIYLSFEFCYHNISLYLYLQQLSGIALSYGLNDWVFESR
jgi:hypothetical protein